MMMKKLFWIFLLGALALSCAPEEAYVPGEADPADCYGVYFPEGQGGSFLVRPSAPHEFTFKAARTRTDDAITVPVVVNAPSAFEAEPIRFEAGQAETSFTVRFPNIEEQVEQSFDLRIEDPKYASRYDLVRHYLAFSVLVGKRKIVPNRRTDWRFQYYSGYYYANTVDGYYGYFTVPASAGSTSDPDFIQQMLDDYNDKLEEHFAGATPTFYTDYSTAAWALFTGAPHYGPTPKSSGYTGTEKDVIAFMVGVTDAPYLTGDYQYIKCTLD